MPYLHCSSCRYTVYSPAMVTAPSNCPCCSKEGREAAFIRHEPSLMRRFEPAGERMLRMRASARGQIAS